MTQLQQLKSIIADRYMVSDFLNQLEDDSQPVRLDISQGLSLTDFIECLQNKVIPASIFSEALITADFLMIHDHVKALEVYLDDFSHYSAQGDLLEAFIRYHHINYAYLSTQTYLAQRGAYYGLVEVLAFAKDNGHPIEAAILATIAAKNGHLKCLEYLHHHGGSWNKYTMNCAVKNGHLNCVEYLHRNGCPWGDDPWDGLITHTALQYGHLPCLEYLHRNGQIKNFACRCVAIYGHLDCLRFLHQKGYPCDNFTLKIAVKHGHLDCVRYLHQHGFLWSDNALFSNINEPPFFDDISLFKAHSGQLECLRYLFENGGMREISFDFEVSDDHLECLKYMVNRGCRLTTMIANLAALNGQLECLKYLHQNGCPWNADATNGAALNGHVKCLKYLHQNGCPWNADATNSAARNGHVECLNRLIQNGCPWGRDTIESAASNGHIECLRHLDIYSHPLNRYAMSLVNGHGHEQDYLKFFQEENCCQNKGEPLSGDGDEHLKCLKYLHQNGYSWNSLISGCFAEKGQLACLQYLHQNGCSWNELTFMSAYNGGHIECVKYLLDTNCPRPFITYPASDPNECLNYFNCHSWQDLYSDPLKNRKLKCSQYLQEYLRLHETSSQA